MRPTRVLAVLLEPAWPARNGLSRRLQAVVEGLAPVCDLTLVSCLRAGETDGSPPGVEHAIVHRSSSRAGSAFQMLAALVRGRPLTSAFYRRPATRKALRELIHLAAPDLLVVHGVGGAVLVQGLFPPGRTLVDFADAEHERVRSIARTLGLKGLPYRVDHRRIAKWCRAELATYRLVSAVSPTDVASFVRLAPEADIRLVPNGVAAREIVIRVPRIGQVLFVGDLNYSPNFEGLRWLSEKVLPLTTTIRVVRVAGRGRALLDEKVQPLGFVEDLDAELAAATCMVAPIRLGAGTRVKILDAFAAGVPVVATNFAAAGLGAEPGTHYLAADDPAAFAAAMDHLNQDHAHGVELAKAARELVGSKFEWSRCLAPLLETVQAASAREHA